MGAARCKAPIVKSTTRGEGLGTTRVRATFILFLNVTQARMNLDFEHFLGQRLGVLVLWYPANATCEHILIRTTPCFR